jgi:hypothetical protein
MSNNFNSIRFLPNHDTITLNRKSASRGEVFYDPTTVSLRIYDGSTVGGYQILRSDFSNIQGSLPSTAFGNASISNARLVNSSTTIGTTAISLGASATTIAGLVSVTSTTFVGALTGNSSTATKLATARNINGVAFDGTQDISIASSSIVNGSYTVSLDSSGALTLPGGSKLVTYANGSVDVTAGPGATTYAALVSNNTDNWVWVDPTAAYISANVHQWTFGTDGKTSIPGGTQFGSDNGAFGFTLVSDEDFTVTGIATGNTVKTFTIGADGNVTVEGKVTATELDVTSSGAITAGTVTTEYAVINGYATISNKPTAKTQVTNKSYVDKRAAAMAVALS